MSDTTERLTLGGGEGKTLHFSSLCQEWRFFLKRTCQWSEREKEARAEAVRMVHAWRRVTGHRPDSVHGLVHPETTHSEVQRRRGTGPRACLGRGPTIWTAAGLGGRRQGPGVCLLAASSEPQVAHPSPCPPSASRSPPGPCAPGGSRPDTEDARRPQVLQLPRASLRGVSSLSSEPSSAGRPGLLPSLGWQFLH